jgi:hypothetical protein
MTPGTTQRRPTLLFAFIHFSLSISNAGSSTAKFHVARAPADRRLIANNDMSVPRGAGSRRMMELCPADRARTPDELGTVDAVLVGPRVVFITGGHLPKGGV